MKEETSSLIQTVADLGNMIATIADAGKINSLSSRSKLTRIEPLCAISEECMAVPFLPDVLNTAVNLVSIFYIQAAMNMSQVGDIRIKGVLDQLNPDRTAGSFLRSHESHGEKNAALESYIDRNSPHGFTYALPTSDTNTHLAIESRLATEDVTMWVPDQNGKMQQQIISDQEFQRRFGKDTLDAYKKSMNQPSSKTSGGKSGGSDTSSDRPRQGGISVDDKVFKILHEPGNLAVGKVFQLDFKHGGDVITIPITIRLASDTLPVTMVEQIMVQHGEDTSFMERYHAARSGRIEWVNDFLLTRDLRKARKEAAINDTSGIYQETLNRVRRNQAAGILTMKPSYNNASAVWVTTKPTIDRVAMRLGGKISDKLVREKLFNNLYAFMIIVLDSDYERVSFYYHDLPYATSVSVKDIKSANKAKGPDITDVLKQYTLGNAPSF